MTDLDYFEAFDAQAQRRAGRRAFFKATLVGAAAAGVATTGSFLTATPAEAQAVTDADVLNFALNLEYLEANFYYYAAYGTAIPTSSIGSAGVPATASAGASGVMYNQGARAVTFSDPSIREYALEIAQDELAHVNFLRAALGGSAVSQPQLDVGIDPNGAFSTAARAAGLIADAGKDAKGNPNPQTTFFDPYAGDVSFLYGAFVFEDVGVTAYKGASPLLTNPVYLDAAAGILATEAYHAAIVRTTLDQLSNTTPTIRADTESISNVRDAVDGSSDDDQGIQRAGSGSTLVSNIVPTDNNGIAFSRSTGQVLNIVYLNTTGKSATGGGFFPAGVNGTIKNSTANS